MLKQGQSHKMAFRISRQAFAGLTLIFSILAFMAGTAFGFLQGLNAFPILDSIPRASLAVSQLKAIESSKVDMVQLILEHEIDYGLAAYTYLQESWWLPFYSNGFLLFDPSDNEELIRRVATYRKHHPSPSRESMFDQVPDEKKDYAVEYQKLSQGIREHLRRVQSTVDRYAKD